MPMTCVRASTPQTVCAPKVDFLPDFTSAPLRHQSHENLLRRNTTQQLYVPAAQPLSSHHTNTSPLPHMFTFKKRPLPTSPLYDGLTIPPLLRHLRRHQRLRLYHIFRRMILNILEILQISFDDGSIFAARLVHTARTRLPIRLEQALFSG